MSTPTITMLLTDIAQSIKLMKKIVQSIGTTSDTIEERRKFTALKTSVQQQIVAAAQKMNRGALNKNYDNQFVLKSNVDAFRKVIEIAVKQFRIYKPHTCHPHVHPHSTAEETRPLLTNTNPFHNASIGRSTTTVTIRDDYDEECKILEENEEKMTYIVEELSEMKEMFSELDGIIMDQQAIVDLIETTVEDSKYDVVSGADHLFKAESKIKKLRCNRCVCLIGFVAILTTFVLYLWLTTRNK
eukprot:67647_1